MTDQRLTIGEVADRADVSISTIRYYDKRGLIPEVERFESSGYRAFPEKTVERLRFIKHAQSLGFSLDEIDELLSLRDDDQTACADMQQVARKKLDEIDARIEQLLEIREGLEALTDICPGDLSTDCPILEVLGSEPLS